MFSGTVLFASSPAGLILLSIAGIGGGIFLFFDGFRLLQRRRLIMDTPFSKIRSASLGMVEISGLACGPYTITAPITQRACYFYRTQVWELQQRGKNSEWVKVASESVHVPFFVDDNTGRVLVNPSGAELDIHRDFQQEFSNQLLTTLDPPPETVSTFLQRHGIATDRKIKVEECCVKPKNALFVVGTLGENVEIDVTPVAIHDAEFDRGVSGKGTTFSLGPVFVSSAFSNFVLDGTTANDTQHQVIRLTPQTRSANTGDMTQQQKIAAALERAGISNPAAWSAAGLESVPVAIDSSPGTPVNRKDENSNGANNKAENSGFESRPRVVLMKGSNNKTFLISWRSQRDVVRSLGWKSMLMIWGGPALFLVSLYVMRNFIHL